MKSEKHILVLTPDGTGIKNYLYADVFKNTDARISLYHYFDADTLSHIETNVSLHEKVILPEYKESIREKFLREAIHTARIKFNAKQEKNPTILTFRKTRHKSLKLKVFYATVSFAAYWYKRYKAIERLEDKYSNSLVKNPFYNQVKNQLSQLQPDVIFCTHQRAVKAATVFKAASDLGIETTTVIYSWDNLPKARLALRADKYFVWSEFMKDELVRFYPEIPSKSIHVTGTPQFEFYFNKENIIDRADFYNENGLDLDKKIICFSGDDVLTSPHDPHYLNDLAEGITKAGMDSYCQIAFRRCPVDLTGRYDWVVQKYPDLIIEMPPLWNFNSKVWTAVYPQVADIKLLVSLAYYSDMVVNVGSTMAFDFGMFQKPCVYINYDHVEDTNWSVNTIYNYQHFRSMPSKKAVYWWNKREEIATVINEALEEPRTEIDSWFQIVVNHPEAASHNLKNQLL